MTTIRKAESTPTKSEEASAPAAEVTRSSWLPRWSPKSQAQRLEVSPPVQTPLDSEPNRARSESTDTIRPERPKSNQIPAPRRVDPLTSPLPRHVDGRKMLEALRTMGSPGVRQLTENQIAAIQATFSVPSAEELAIRAAQEIDWSLTPYMRWRRYGDIALHRPRNLDMSTSNQPRQRTSQETVIADQAGHELVRRSGLPSRFRNDGQRNRVSPRPRPDGGVGATPHSSDSGSSRSSQDTIRGVTGSSYSSYEAIPRYQLYDAPMEEQGVVPSSSVHQPEIPCAEVQAAMQALHAQLENMRSQNADAAASPRMKLSEAISAAAAAIPSRSRPAGQGPVHSDSTPTDEIARQERRDTAFEVPSAAITKPTASPGQTTQVPSILQTAHHLRDSTPPRHTRTFTPSQPQTPRTPSLLTKINTLTSIKTSLRTAQATNTTPPSEQTLLSEITWLRADIHHLSQHPSNAGKKVLAEFKLEGKKVELGRNRAWQAEGRAKAVQIQIAGQTSRPREAVQWPPPRGTSIYARRHGSSLKPSPSPPFPTARHHPCPWRIELYKTLPRWKSIFGPAKSVEGLSALVPPPLTREASYSGPASPVEETKRRPVGVGVGI
ncbi:hypothetical protein LTR78_007597 [Recurvomyces mirabilis]|uniref:Uncharacterized protein n=1 Tax=Recurvomyces mirabilis TaxID=574656 RepID=A0AAE0TU61_9PEZI|nr:hypothetical protein LTR78_007597 [Recurvomyces mirabilis]KAK5159891.1 hypothetical protein LTS14_001997 [Recurvomyces mirabilis]